MNTVTTTLYILKVVSTNVYSCHREVGSVVADTINFSELDSYRDCYVLLGTKEVEVEYEDRDVTAEAIEAIERMNDEIMAKARAAVERNNERIANLRCLTHQPESSEDLDDLPF